ncbi:alkaline phosphatase [Bacillus sp. VT 712]|uniref:Alkaline phosphatase n=1 Tax=Priestia veravalensis TaxID=1414648 RepID=A0A0V8JNT3_9BACI|nr:MULTISPECIES: DedA family protein [Bacillaceae]KSU88724.1 alkaline phosphatase [Priestia veravalensis]KZB92070.1 alkaline phosphatase [Bacillus sp. VT 712]MEC0667438.1 DedA family protein [Priestia flexa]MED3825016.1 DedA family protein [Priestia flexa]SCC05160.1 membrane protein DedA, SNARE-associated domain [Priestia flexa]
MLETIVLSLVEALKQLSYFGVILALTFEFVPAELVLPLVGYWVYQGDMNLYLAILAGTVGGVFGPLTLYALGRYGGRPLVLKYGKYFLVKEKEIDAADRFFNKYGAGVAFFGRFIPGVRTAISLPCGMAKMNVWQFSIYTFVAMLPITALYVYLGYKLGPQWEDVGPIVSQYMQPIGIGLLVIIVIFFMFKYVKKK